MTTLSVCQCSSSPKQTEAEHSYCCQVGLMQLLTEPKFIFNFTKLDFFRTEILGDVESQAGLNFIFITDCLLPDICCLLPSAVGAARLVWVGWQTEASPCPSLIIRVSWSSNAVDTNSAAIWNPRSRLRIEIKSRGKEEIETMQKPFKERRSYGKHFLAQTLPGVS